MTESSKLTNDLEKNLTEHRNDQTGPPNHTNEMNLTELSNSMVLLQKPGIWKFNRICKVIQDKPDGDPLFEGLEPGLFFVHFLEAQ